MMKIFKVFTNEAGEHGNPVGIVIDENSLLNNKKRLQITQNSGFSEVVFINNLKENIISIYNPQEEIQFAGHALVGTTFYLRQTSTEFKGYLNCKIGKVNAGVSGDGAWISASIKNTPSWNHIQLENVNDIESISTQQATNFKHSFIWSWVNQQKGTIRARTFASDWGIPEDEANGSGAMQLAHLLGRNLTIFHGKGSIIHGKPINGDIVKLAGLIREVERR